MEFVNFLKNPQQYIELGAKIPKGAILTGRLLLTENDNVRSNFYFSIAEKGLLERVKHCWLKPRQAKPMFPLSQYPVRSF